MAYDQIKCYGMSDALGHVSFGPHTEEQEPGVKPYSKSLAALIDQVFVTLVVCLKNHVAACGCVRWFFSGFSHFHPTY